jgi:DNA-binding NtrC family response regulator
MPLLPKRGFMNNGAHVLVVSRDQMLLQTRKMILGAFFQAESAGRVPEAERLMKEQNFDLIVLCYSLADDEYAKMLELAKKQAPVPKILTLRSAGNHHHRGDAENQFMIENGPYGLLKKTSELLGFQLKGTGKLAAI